MPQFLKPAPPVVSASASFHADQASRLLLEKREQLASTELAAHENTTALIDPVDLENAFRKVDTDCNKLGHGWLLSLRRQHPDYAPTQRREQEPSTPSVENLWQFLRENWLGNRIFQSYADILDQCCEAWNKIIAQPWRIMSIGLRQWTYMGSDR